MKSLLLGETDRIVGVFRPTIVLPAAPSWTLYDWNGDPMQTGTAVQLGTGSMWEAEITIPTNIPVPSGTQVATVEFAAADVNGVQQNLTVNVEVVAARDVAEPYGLLAYNSSLTGSFVADQPVTKIVARLCEGYGAGTELYSQEFDNPVPVSNSLRGDVYTWTLTDLALTTAASGGYYPYHAKITASFGAPGSQDLEMMKPVVYMTPMAASMVNTLRRYLDKGQFVDIDPHLQWADDELIHFLIEGCQYVNAAGSAMSNWSIDTLPAAMNKWVSIAAAWEALNASYQAEGKNAFNFSSGGADLQWDRTQYISTKMEELKATLDMGLAMAKNVAIRTFGPGQPLAGGQRMGTMGTLGINYGPTTNIRVPRGWLRPGVGYMRYLG